MIHDFKKSLVLGDKGEKLLLDTYSYLSPANCDACDIMDTRNNNTIEVKTDYYDMNTTDNFFIEVWSDDNNFKLGGLERASKYGTHIYLYQFIKNNTIFWFNNIPEALRIIDNYVKKYNILPSKVKNRNYNTIGYKIPRKLLSSVVIELSLGEDLPTILALNKG